MARNKSKKDDRLQVADNLNDDVLAKLKTAKKELEAIERKEEEKKKKQRIREREEREKNKSFEELLNEYGDKGSKY